MRSKFPLITTFGLLAPSLLHLEGGIAAGMLESSFEGTGCGPMKKRGFRLGRWPSSFLGDAESAFLVDVLAKP